VLGIPYAPVKIKRRFHSEDTEKTNLVVPKSIKDDALKAARAERLSLSQWVVRAICEKLEGMKKNNM